MDYSKTCRLCLIETEFDEMKRIVSLSVNNISYLEMIKYCTGLEPQEADLYPSSICSECEDLLIKLYNFKVQIMITNARLESLDVVQEKNYSDTFDSNIVKLEIEKLNDTTQNSISLHSDTIEEEYLDTDEYWSINSTDDIETDNQSVTDKNLIEDAPQMATPVINKNEEVTSSSKKSSNDCRGGLCLVCGKLFRNIQLHSLTHKVPEDRPKIYVCTICNRGFSNKNYLNIHMRKHTDDKRYECEYCGKNFLIWSSRRLHIYREHTGQYRFTCHICGKKFIQTSNYNSHMFIHTGEKPEKCDICEKKFSTKETLKRHKISHINVRNYICKICQKGYKCSKALREHMKIHNDERNYKCPVCPQAFIQNHVLRSHVAKKHPGYELPPPGTILSQRALKRQQETLNKMKLWLNNTNNSGVDFKVDHSV